MEREGIVVAVVAVVVVVVVVVASVAEIAWRDGESQSWGTRLDFGAKRVIWSYLVQNAGPPFLFLYFVSEFSV